MAPDVGPDERTLRHDQQSFAADVLQGGQHQLLADALTLVFGRYLGVGQDDEPFARHILDQGHVALSEIELVTLFGRIVDHCVFLFHSVCNFS